MHLRLTCVVEVNSGIERGKADYHLLVRLLGEKIIISPKHGRGNSFSPTNVTELM